MTLESNWKRCGACGSPVCAFGVGDNTLTFGKETYHADCVELVTSEEALWLANEIEHNSASSHVFVLTLPPKLRRIAEEAK